MVLTINNHAQIQYKCEMNCIVRQTFEISTIDSIILKRQRIESNAPVGLDAAVKL